MPSKPITWTAPPHTIAKIAILEDYLKRWFAIMGQTVRTPLLYVDGFAGPGHYDNFPTGSPIAALRSALLAREASGTNWRAGDAHCVFVESDGATYRHLVGQLAPFESQRGLEIRHYGDTFVGGLASLRADVPQAFDENWPRFFFLDPFGATGIPFAVVESILRAPLTEVLVNLDADGIQRILKAGAAADHERLLTEIFGDRSWEQAIDLAADSRAQYVQVLQLYKSRLRTIPKVRYAWAFEMATRTNRLEYYLVFASQHFRGLEEMKEAMRKMSQGGEYRFSDRRDQQPELELFREDDAAVWSRRLYDAFHGREVSYEDLRDFALNETPFINPKAMLRSLRDKATAIPKLGVKIRKGTFPEDKLLRIRLD